MDKNKRKPILMVTENKGVGKKTPLEITIAREEKLSSDFKIIDEVVGTMYKYSNSSDDSTWIDSENFYKVAEKAKLIIDQSRSICAADIEEIDGEFAEAERALLRLDPSGENLDATRIYEILEWFKDKCKKSE